MQDLLHSLQFQLRSWDLLDWFIAASLAVSMSTAFLRGLIASLVSLLGLCAAVVAAITYSPRIAPMLLAGVGQPITARLVAFLLVLATVYFSVALVGRLLQGVCRAIGLGFFDRLAGAVFGLARGILLLASLALPLEPYLQHSVEGRSSLLLPYLRQVSHGVFSVVPQDMRDRLFIGRIGL